MPRMDVTENYLESILILAEQRGQVRSVDLASFLGVTRATVSHMLRHFRDEGLVEMDPSGALTLTKRGIEIAAPTLERHRTLTQMLLKLGVSAENAALDACRMEHGLSDEAFACIKSWLEEQEH